MPLPDAPPTDQSRVYREFASKTALPGASTGITAALLDNFKNSLFLDEYSEDELRRLLLLQLATGTGSVSGPLPDTAQVVETTITSSGEQVIAFTPGVGEVWEFQGVDAKRSGSGQILYQAYLTDTTNGTEVYFYYQNNSDSSVAFFSDADSRFFNSPIYFDENVQLKLEATENGGSFTSVIFSTAVIRVR